MFCDQATALKVSLVRFLVLGLSYGIYDVYVDRKALTQYEIGESMCTLAITLLYRFLKSEITLY